VGTTDRAGGGTAAAAEGDAALDGTGSTSLELTRDAASTSQKRDTVLLSTVSRWPTSFG